MIHNKYFEIMRLFLGDYNKKIYGRELVGKVELSQKGIALALKELESEKWLRSEKKGNMKFYFININNPRIKDMMVVVEKMEKIKFMGKDDVLTHIFGDDERIVCVFGSQVKGYAEEGSDIDVLVVGPEKPKDYEYRGKLFDREVDVKYYGLSEFRKFLREKDPLINQIVKHHVIMTGAEKFINLLWGDYYGFDKVVFAPAKWD